MNYAVQENLNGLIFAADIEKAFDSVDHKFIFASLEKYSFGSDFIQWIKTLPANNESCVMNNGSSTGFFKIQRGTKQGDPLSPYLFILVLEILFIQIRNDKAVRGFKIGDIEIRLTAFADDSTFFVRDKQSINRNLIIMKTFGTFSSLNASIEKCEVCWIGQSRFRKDRPANCKLTSLVTSSIKILGVHFSYNKEIPDDKNFSDLLNCMRSVLNTWHHHYLTLGRKIQVFKSLIASKLVYIATMKTVPKHVLDSMQALHRDFIWNSKKPKIKHSTLIGNYSDGGLKDIDLTFKLESLKFSWIKRLRDTTDFHPWKVLAYLILKSVGGNSIFHSNLSLSKLTKQRIEQLPLFYVDAINLFIHFAFILRQNSPIYDPYLSSRGIKTLKDVIDSEGNNRKCEYKSDKYQLKPVDFLSWYGLLNSIPKQWKKKLQIEPAVDNTFDEDRCPLSVNDKVIDISRLTSRQIYSDLVHSKYRAPSAQQYFIKQVWSK